MFNRAHYDIEAGGVFTEVQGGFFAVNQESLVAAVFGFVVLKNILHDIGVEVVKVSDGDNREEVIDIIEIFVSGLILFPVCDEGILDDLGGFGGERRVGVVAVRTVKVAEVRVLIKVVEEGGFAVRTNNAFHFVVRNLVGSREFGETVIIVLTLLVGEADADNVGVVAVQDKVTGVGFDEFSDFFDQSFHFTSAVELVAEEIEDNKGIDFEVFLGVEDGDPMFIGFEEKVVAVDFAFEVGGLEESSGDSPGDIVAV